MSTQSMPISWSAIHGVIFVGVFLFVSLVFAGLTWPWFLLIPLAAYYALVAAIPPLRRTVPRLAVGRVDWRSGLIGILLIAVTSAALLSYQTFFDPDVSVLAARLPVGAFGNLILAGVCFSLLNALLEEWIFRGVLYEALVAEWGATVAIGATAVLFGLGHRQGYPPGSVGVILAGGYGVALGLLRWWTGGLGVILACHVTADATIIAILASTGSFAEYQA
jgi:uncharacterized protein